MIHTHASPAVYLQVKKFEFTHMQKLLNIYACMETVSGKMIRCMVLIQACTYIFEGQQSQDIKPYQTLLMQ